MKRQRGQVMLYGALAAGAVIIALGIALKIQSARLDAAQQKTVALEQQVAQWQGVAKDCSDATEKLALEAKNRATAAQAALRRAKAASAGSAAEIARLRASKADSCEKAVAEIRTGLKP